MSLIIDADSEYLSGVGLDLLSTTATEFTMAICVKRVSGTSTYQSYCAMSRGLADNYGAVDLAHVAEGPDCFIRPSGYEYRNASGTGANTTAWQWLILTMKKDVAFKVYTALPGGSVNTYNGPTPPYAFNSATDEIKIGNGILLNAWMARARLAHCVVWDIELTSGQVADLVSGGTGGISKNPQAIANGNLKFYAPLTSDATVTVGGITLSATGTLTYDGADNPNVEAYGGGATNYTLTIDAGTYTLSGESLLTPVSVSATLDAGTYSITGQDIGFGGSVAYTLMLDSGAYNMTSETPVIGISMGLDSGSYSSTGQDLTLSASIGGGGTTYSLSLDAGDYVVTGQDLAMIMSYLASLDTGSYTATGSNVRLVSSTEPVIISSGTHTISVSIKIGI